MRSLCAVAMSVALAGCGGGLELDEDFDIPRTETFAQNLSSYGLFSGDIASLQPADGVELYELNSVLFTDYAHKQRLIKLPAGSQMQLGADAQLSFPEGSVIAKTFFYENDERDPAAGRRVLETRLLVLRQGEWNSATYLWNEAQTDAEVLLDGATLDVSWIDADGTQRQTDYEVPNEVACVSCHQSGGNVALLGVTARHLNRDVVRNGQTVNQWSHLAAQGQLTAPDVSTLPEIVDYKDTSKTLEQRARAYLDINCAHCHNPDAWELPADEELDFRYTTPFAETGIEDEANAIDRLVSEGQMPYIGTTVLHVEGVELLLEFIEPYVQDNQQNRR